MSATTPVRIPVEGGAVDGDLSLPQQPRGVVVFAHGSGSSRHSRRNRRVARGFQEAGLATLLMDLLTPEEEQVDLLTHQWRFDIGLLSQRLVAAVDLLADAQDTAALPVATFGASTGGAAALRAAAARPELVRAVVSRGGRPDLAGEALSAVRAPTLLLVGGEDRAVLALNREAAEHLAVEHALHVVPGAGHLFEEPGAMDEVVATAVAWLDRWLPGDQPRR